MRLSRHRSRYYGRRVRQLLRLQAHVSCRHTQFSCSMKHQLFNNSFYVLARGQAKPGHFVWVNGERHRGATNLPLARSGRTHLRRFASRCKAWRSHRPPSKSCPASGLSVEHPGRISLRPPVARTPPPRYADVAVSRRLVGAAPSGAVSTIAVCSTPRRLAQKLAKWTWPSG